MSPGTLPVTGPHARRGNLPLQVTSFVGREREMAEITRLLTTTRLLTLTGAGGCGKTRLALEAAADLRDDYPDGVWLVELAALADPTLLPRSVATAIGARELPNIRVAESLTEWLQSRHLLLILDNCEHLVVATARLAEQLLGGCPHLRLLATSREPLGCAGETAWRVPSLSLPPELGSSREAVAGATQYEAVRLFLDRAYAALPGFMITEQNTPAIVETCRRLDGIPLAIELAAARVRVFPVEQIAARLDDRFRLLTSGHRTAMPRQQTLRAMVDWSYNLLSEPERALLRRLSVFAGGWDFEAAEAAGAGDGIQPHAVLDLLVQLVEKSLVLAEERRGVARYRLLETIRQYAREKLEEMEEADRTRDRHLDHFLRLAEESEPKLRGAEDRITVEHLEAEHDNLRAALEWSLARGRPDDAALRLSGALSWFWWIRSYHEEGEMWLIRALAAASARSAPRMKALWGAGWLAHHRRDAATARALLSESLDIARELRDPWSEAWALHGLGRVAYFENDAASARALGEQSLEIAEATGDQWLIAWAPHLLGLAAHIAADYPTARSHYARSLEIRRDLGYHDGIGILLILIGIVALREGDDAEALAHFHEGLQVVQLLHGPWGLLMPLAGCARVAAAHGQPVRAARLAGAVAALGETYPTPMIGLMETLLLESIDMARQALAEPDYAAARAEGQSMSLDDAVAEALSVELPAPVETNAPVLPSHGVPFGNLTAAELHVLRLLVAGKTTREIASELVVAVSTVDRHLTHIYQKLGVRNRGEAIAVTLKDGLP